MSIKDFRTRNEIVVKVGKKDDRKDRHVRKGTPDPSKPREGILKRRTKKRGINFYDMGQVRAGSAWTDTSFQILTDPEFVGDFAAPAALISTDYDDRNASLFAVPSAAWPNTFRKITKGHAAERYELFVIFGSTSGFVEDLDEWTTGGLIVEQADLDSGLYAGPPGFGHYFFDFIRARDGEANVKITTTPVYSDPAAAFAPVPQMDIFFPPKLGFLRGRAGTTTFGDRGDYGELFLTFPRRFKVNTDDEYQGGDVSPDPAPGAGMDPATGQAISNWIGVVPGRGYFYEQATTTWSSGVFPPAGTNRRGIFYQGADPNFGPLNGVLLAVIKKDSTFYYFWTDGFV